MFSCLKLIVWIPAFAAMTCFVALAQPTYDNIGRAATAKEVQAWDIDVRADFKGLPKGAGSVVQGEQVWEAKCASCHGSFGELNTVFSPIMGFTTKKDSERGKVAMLQLWADAPTRTTLMKVSQLSTLWDYINRAMPWNAPKSLSADQVFAVTAYMLNIANVVPDDFVLSDGNIADVQKRMPNRTGVTTKHALWPGREFGGASKPDVQGSSCVKDCKVTPEVMRYQVASFIPDYARNQHGNLAQQFRPLGGARGVDTTKTSPTAATPSSAMTQNNANVFAKRLVDAAK